MRSTVNDKFTASALEFTSDERKFVKVT